MQRVHPETERERKFKCNVCGLGSTLRRIVNVTSSRPTYMPLIVYARIATITFPSIVMQGTYQHTQHYVQRPLQGIRVPLSIYLLREWGVAIERLCRVYWTSKGSRTRIITTRSEVGMCGGLYLAIMADMATMAENAGG
jgi:hypothetical protein